MLTLLIVLSIMLTALCADFRAVLKAGRRRLTVLYTVLAVLSLALSAYYCLTL